MKQHWSCGLFFFANRYWHYNEEQTIRDTSSEANVCLWCFKVKIKDQKSLYSQTIIHAFISLGCLITYSIFSRVTFFPADLIFAAAQAPSSRSIKSHLVWRARVCLCLCLSRRLLYCPCQEDEPWRRAGWRGAAGWSGSWWQTAERRGEPASSPWSSRLVERQRHRNDVLLSTCKLWYQKYHWHRFIQCRLNLTGYVE